ncbi:acyl-CoA N-acyltransferase [Aspergillus phoenicis ATCC 13157]|uniref:Acyl-CoA N-acyltransferase n=1 Tax=Aspergillus phoenicis ATCC 13157 TaxID=1353007 RepID=A0A370PCD2_ASPPH|nr:acyl-CoA N-acyltransferase [Aspergillus phoenicis ATCC 13157]
MTTVRPLGPPVDLTPAQWPSATTLHGRFIQLEKLEPKHANDLFDLIGGDDSTRAWLWDYMPDGPYSQREAFEEVIASRSVSPDPFFFAVIDKRASSPSCGKAIGYISLLRITPAQWTLEIGHVMFSSVLQRTPAATEAIYLLARYAFEQLHYRRVEWKCNSLNAPSMKAAQRLGFVYEGTFRQHMVVKGRNRDTAWFAMVRDDWEEGAKEALEQWLEEGNFDQDGHQKKGLQNVREELKRSRSVQQ